MHISNPSNCRVLIDSCVRYSRRDAPQLHFCFPFWLMYPGLSKLIISAGKIAKVPFACLRFFCDVLLGRMTLGRHVPCGAKHLKRFLLRSFPLRIANFIQMLCCCYPFMQHDGHATGWEKHLSWILFSFSCYFRPHACMQKLNSFLHSIENSPFFIQSETKSHFVRSPRASPGIVHPEFKSFFLFFFCIKRLDNLRRPKLQINCFKNKIHHAERERERETRTKNVRGKMGGGKKKSVGSVQAAETGTVWEKSGKAFKMYKSCSHAFVRKFLWSSSASSKSVVVAAVAAVCIIFYSWQILKLVFVLHLQPTNYFSLFPSY